VKPSAAASRSRSSAARHAADLAEQADFAEHREVGGSGRSAATTSRRRRRRHRAPVRRRSRRRPREEDVTVGEADAGPLLEHREQEREAAGVDALGDAARVGQRPERETSAWT